MYSSLTVNVHVKTVNQCGVHNAAVVCWVVGDVVGMVWWFGGVLCAGDAVVPPRSELNDHTTEWQVPPSTRMLMLWWGVVGCVWCVLIMNNDVRRMLAFG